MTRFIISHSNQKGKKKKPKHQTGTKQHIKNNSLTVFKQNTILQQVNATLSPALHVCIELHYVVFISN